MINISKLELDVMSASDLKEAAAFTHKHKLSSMVVHHDLVADAQTRRAIDRGRYQILVPIDWPKGESYGPSKFFNIKLAAMGQDGFEILLSNLSNGKQVASEMIEIINFIRGAVSENAVVRFVIGADVRPHGFADCIVDALYHTPPISMIRMSTTTNYKPQNIENACKLVDDIKSTTKALVKSSCGMNTIECMGKLRADKYAVNLQQARKIEESWDNYLLKLREKNN